MIQTNHHAPIERHGRHESGAHEIGELERLASIALGAGLVAASLTNFVRGRSMRGLVYAAAGGALTTRGMTGRCAVYRRLGVESDDAGAMSGPLSRFVHVRRAITVNATAEDLYNRWRNLEQLPQILSHLKQVEVIDGARSRWLAEGPLNVCAQWTATIERDEPGRLIAWRSEPGATVETRGKIEFLPAPARRGAIVKVDLAYHPPGGAVGAAAARLFGNDPDREIRNDLRRFKQMIETGEVSTSAGPSGRDLHAEDGRPPRRSRRQGLAPGVTGRQAHAAARIGPDRVDEACMGSFPASDPPPF